ncbi:AMP-binding enzyme, partial [Acidiplasma aeolicum]
FSVFNGYYSNYDEAVEDEYNHIWVLGRTDDVINVAGHRLSTMEMENSIMSIPEISDAAVIGIDDEIKGLIPAAFITLNNRTVDYNEIKNRIKNVINDSIGKFAIPGKIYIISEMPKTRSGKIMRRLLREILSKGDISGDITGLENPESIEKIKNELKNSN